MGNGFRTPLRNLFDIRREFFRSRRRWPPVVPRSDRDEFASPAEIVVETQGQHRPRHSSLFTQHTYCSLLFDFLSLVFNWIDQKRPLIRKNQGHSPSNERCTIIRLLELITQSFGQQAKRSNGDHECPQWYEKNPRIVTVNKASVRPKQPCPFMCDRMIQ